MKNIFALMFCLSFAACSVGGKSLPATCEQQLKNLTVLEQELVAVRLALEICAAQPPAQ